MRSQEGAGQVGEASRPAGKRDRPAPRLTGSCRGLATEEPGLAARDHLEASVLGGRWQALGSGGQECIEVLQPCDLEERGVTQRGQAVKGVQHGVRSHLTEPGGMMRTQERGVGRAEGKQAEAGQSRGPETARPCGQGVQGVQAPRQAGQARWWGAQGVKAPHLGSAGPGAGPQRRSDFTLPHAHCDQLV